MHLAHDSAPEWMVIDDAITQLAASKGALDVELGRWLLAARLEGVERMLGFGSFAEYVERRLGFDARTTSERLRVARALEVLPAIEGLLRAGRRSWSAVRELTRVATPDNEAAWVEASERMTVREVEGLVAGREPGDDPWDPRDPVLAPHRLVLELPADELADWQEAAERVRLEIGPAATNREVLRALVQKELGARPESQPGYQTAVTLCAGCERAWQQAGGELVEVAPAVGDCARCDGSVVGVVEVEGEAVGAASAHVGGARGAEHRHAAGWGRAEEDLEDWADAGRSAHVGSDGAGGSAHVGGDGADAGWSAHVGALADDEPGLAAILGRLVPSARQSRADPGDGGDHRRAAQDHDAQAARRRAHA